ncbi:uncharacterized protein N7477_001506 [Penicillium maclennaniae]|uniref:uncharacterized protein n=1 Tax=Penicillium maclennaniae TaxID=1343394 RepID=UPI00253FBD88|nr:uncharacterized protein N7477_001506 [Penicillium maclennaniae]KAJ5681566.1 hypothetical protein N7477_001506 [Penicillium maclennaniae]
MECLAAGRHSLQRAKACSSPISHRLLSYSSPHRQYALIPTPRRMGANDRGDAHDTHESSEGTDTKTSTKLKHTQAHPLSGYYKLVLNGRSPYEGRAASERLTTIKPEDKSLPASPSEADTPRDRMAIVFGTRLAGPGRQSRYNPGETPPEHLWRTINGVPIPPRPDEPDNCCMSGCVHCVWDDFRDEMEDWAARLSKAKAKGGPEKGTTDMHTAPRAEVDSASQSMDDDGGGSASNWSAPSQDDELFSSIPVGIREFMKTEKKLRIKHQKEAST